MEYFQYFQKQIDRITLIYINIPSGEISFQGVGGYINAAFWIWSEISSSSLNGNVPLRLQENKYLPIKWSNLMLLWTHLPLFGTFIWL